jgi:signal transduction histidine kinase
VFLALSALVAIWRDPGEGGHSVWASGLLAFYIAQGVFIILLLRRRQQSTASFRLLVHSADVLWPALILTFTTGQSNPFFLFFLFVLAAAAYRWGLWETIGTAAAEVALLWLEGFALHLGIAQWLNRGLLAHHWPLLAIDAADFEPKRLFMRSIYLLVMGLLLGYLAEQQKQLRAEKAVIARILGKVRVESGLTGTLQEIAGELVSMYGAKSTVMASQEANSYRVFLGELRASERIPPVFHWLEASSSDRETYLGESTANASYAFQTNAGKDSFRVVALDESGDRLRQTSGEYAERLRQQREFRRVMSVSFIFGREWWGRIFLFDPTLTGDTEEELRFLQELVRQVGPAVYNVYLLRRLRMRAGAVERARVARELHDGAVQSLIAVEMQVDVLRRQAENNKESVSGELGRIQGLLREEVLKLRELMQQMKSLDVDSRKLLGFLGDAVERFQRETGISARFLSDVEELEMPPQVCREVARIVQEGLVNVRKHSGARQVLVRLGQDNGSLSVMIEDDGRGFPFAGRLSQGELEKMGKGPLIIKERVRLIAGELTIESNPGRGSRLEIHVPQKPGR